MKKVARLSEFTTFGGILYSHKHSQRCAEHRCYFKKRDFKMNAASPNVTVPASVTNSGNASGSYYKE